VAQLLKKTSKNLVKTMIYQRPDKTGFAVLVRGDHEVSEYKIKKAETGAYLASRDFIGEIGSAFGFSGPFGLNQIKFYVDEDVLAMRDFVTGANERDQHLIGVNVEDIFFSRKREILIGDFRQAAEGDEGELAGKKVPLYFKTAIELGHIFKLNLRYSQPLKANFLDANGKENPMIMGCYGIGVNRILAAAIEQHGNDKGIVWPLNISPYPIEVILIDPKDALSQEILKTLSDSPEMRSRGVDILVDDRPDSAGIKFNDADLIGIPLRIILGPKNLKNGKVEFKLRKTAEQTLIDIPNLIPEVLSCLDKLT